MTPAEVMAKLKEIGVSMRADGGKLLLEPGSKVPADFVDAIKENKLELMALLTETSTAPLLWECGCIWNEACLPAPIRCRRCEQAGICPTCRKCRGCWLARVIGREVVVPIER
jgi:hypothetical protein